ncbi:MAG: sulfite exporter TauE/SafE family protein [Spirochaetes bacterium]|jgi:hypothetical protein|nr:sulfite exporter TauE/SafE family protein [Spirochaetota bacterium]
MDNILIVIPLFFLVALVHSSAGLGGGSSYLAIMTLASFPYEVMPRTALLCIIMVVSITCCKFYKSGNLDIKRALPFVLGSVPMAFIGGSIKIDKEIFLFLLGISLIAASTNMIFFDTEKRRKLKHDYFNNLVQERDSKTKIKSRNFIFELCIGAGLGFLSGLIGIGGGIFLAPILYLKRWSYAKQISATASFFIFINSISGLAGQVAKGNITVDIGYITPLLAAVFFGSQIGSHFGAFRLSNIAVKRTTAMIVMYAGITTLYKSLL